MGVMEQNRRNSIKLGQDNNALTWLIIINAVVFVIINFIKIIYYFSDIPVDQFFYKQVLDWFTLPAEASKFAERPWTLLTYMFTHEGVWHLISSLLWLWGFGYIMQDMTGNNKLIPVYLYGGAAGAILFIVMANVLPSLKNSMEGVQPLIGAGASVMAVAIATTTLAPHYKIFPMINGGIPLWVLTLVFVAINFGSIAGSTNGTPLLLAQLGGAGIGYVFVRQLRRGNDWSTWMNNFVRWVDDLFNPEKKHKKPAPKQQHFYKATKKPYEKTPHITQQKLDEILDKINQKGYHFLTDEEKDFLKKASQDI
jgi:membrane associated rhomboid family serine protease